METAAEVLFVASPLGELGIAASERAVTGLFSAASFLLPWPRRKSWDTGRPRRCCARRPVR